MNPLPPHRLNTLLNEYLDGALNQTDRASVEEAIASDPSVRDEYDRLRKLRRLLSEQNKMEPNPAFWTRLSVSLNEDTSEDNLLPFPRRYIPSAAIASLVGVVLIGLVVFKNRMPLLHFLSQKSHIVQSAYEEGILKGSILPLLSHVDNNQVLEFSLLGVLPLDKKSDLALKVDQSASNGYQIKLGKTSPQRSSKRLTARDFYAEIQATDAQKQIIDSLCGLARTRIEGSVLVNEDRAVAIDPELAQLNKVMVSNIAACLEPVQRVRFSRFLEKRDAPYTFVSKKFLPADPESIYVEMRRLPVSQRFVVVTPDTMTFAHVNTDMIRQVQRQAEVTRTMQDALQRNLQMTERLLRSYAERLPQPEDIAPVANRPFEIWSDDGGVGIRFQRDLEQPHWEVRQPVVVPLPRRMKTYTMTSPSGRLEIGVYGDSVTPGEVLVDSAMVRFFNQHDPQAYNLRMMDSIFSSLTSRFQISRGAFSLDSVFQNFEAARQRAYEESRRQRRALDEEARLKKKGAAVQER